VTARDKELVGLRKDRSIEQAGAKQRITDLERQLAARDEELAGLRRDLMSEQADAKSQNIAAKERVTDLETQLAARDKELVGLRSELSAGQAADKQRVADLERQLAARDEELARLRNELSTEQAAAKQRVTDLEMQVAARDKELAGLRSELSTELAKLQEAQRGLIRELRPEIEKGDITVDLNNERLLINLASGYLFATGEDQLKPDGADALKDVGAILKDYPEYKVSVEGHTDNRPIRSAALKKKFPTNQELSEARAGSAAEALTAGGLSTVSTVGYGEKRPVASNTTEEGRAKNRRVEVRVTK
jgi:chemotaxis protein MotB